MIFCADLGGLYWEKAMVVYTKLPKWMKEEMNSIWRERDKMDFFYFRFERG